ncbi:hypothetical protein [Oryzomonas rubra]|uniref:Uncharacterized protein n=1 Tax=Oryzomonas rubra TaxID=2509454 RepID=A0A5A9X6Z1_9BACT|nr:hypothetical protein [Oryzomonas rubra]KAA0888730.1 hypothetical protein ET418_15230 [Oryzomonas rubra]
MYKIFMVMMMVVFMAGCKVESTQSSDNTQQQQQERILQEGSAQTGMPAIKNFREKKLLKDIYELRDQDGLVTYTYIVAEMTGKLVYLGESIGYGIPAATQYTNPQKIAEKNTYQSGSYAILPQADPNGLFSPASAEGTWVMLKDPHGGKVRPVYVEQRIVVAPFKMQ